jgi:hypothetical protein
MMHNRKSCNGLNDIRRMGLLLAMAAGLAIPAASAAAQNALGDGRLLEKQTGNAPLPPVRNRNDQFKAQMRYNDAVVTGNATGGRAFRGNAGYRASDDFRSRIASDDLFRFQRDALPQNWALVGSSNFREELARKTDLRRMGSDVNGMLGRGVPNQSFTGRPKQLSTEAERQSLGLTSGSLRSTSSFQIGRALSPSTVGRVETGGVIRSTQASALRGLTVLEEMSDRRDEREEKRPTQRLDTSLRSKTSYEELQERLGKIDLRADQPSLTQPGAEKTPAEKPIGAQPARRDDLDSRLDTKLDTRPDGKLDTKLENQPGGRTIPGGTPEGGVGSRPKDDLLESNDPAARLPGESVRLRDPVTGLPSASAGSEVWRQRMTEIRKALDEEEKSRAIAKQKKGVTKSDTLNEAVTAEERSRRGAVARLNRDSVRAIRETGGTVDRFVTNLSPGGEERDLYAEQMLKGQQLLAQGRYFDSEECFVRAASLRPEDATALVGRLHAQLGAGMVLSASTNLRQLVRDHPELLGVRYAASLLPNPERLKNLETDLDLSIHPILEERLDLRARREAALLKAYVGFQRGDRATIANSLRMMEDTSKQMGEDQTVFAELLRGVWLGEDADK